jgi:hypothetical protein
MLTRCTRSSSWSLLVNKALRAGFSSVEEAGAVTAEVDWGGVAEPLSAAMGEPSTVPFSASSSCFFARGRSATCWSSTRIVSSATASACASLTSSDVGTVAALERGVVNTAGSTVGGGCTRGGSASAGAADGADSAGADSAGAGSAGAGSAGAGAADAGSSSTDTAGAGIVDAVGVPFPASAGGVAPASSASSLGLGICAELMSPMPTKKSSSKLGLAFDNLHCVQTHRV